MAAGPEVTEGRTIDVLRRQLAAAQAERDEAQAQQAALAEVLQAINVCAGDFKSVFDMLADKAIALCDAAGGELVTFDGDIATAVSLRNARPGLVDFWKTPQRIAGTNLELVRREGKTIQRPDMREAESYRKGHPLAVAGVELGGIRTFLQVPLRSDQGVIGLFMIFRHEVRPFTYRQVALVEAFAAQAVIAVDNARLLSEQREALARQTATAEVLQVINSSPGNLAAVFDAILEKARALCDAVHGDLWTYDGKVLHLAATHGEPGFAAWLKAQGPVPVWPGSPTEALMKGADHVQYEDPVRDGHFEAVPEFLAQVQRAGVRSTLFVPMWKDGALLGVVIVYRREVRRFGDKQIAVLQGFAAQAVIAMENARLLTEQREALEQQTAATEVLEVINASPGDLAPVFGAMLEKAMILCEAAFGIFGRFDGKLFEPAVDRGVPVELIKATRQIQSPPPNSGLGRIAAGESVVQLVDLANSDLYRSGFIGATALVDIGGARTAIFVALRKDNELLGVIVMYRREVRAFSDKQVALLQNFAAQAVIAMENARLLNEQRETLEQQIATAEILRVIAQSPTDVAPVLSVVVKAARRFCGAEDVVISLRDGEELAIAAHEGPIGAPPPRRKLDRSSTQGRAVVDASTIHLPDVAELDPAEWSAVIALSQQIGAKATVAAPLLREGAAVGAIMLRKRVAGPFTERQIQLLETFAAQAVIAIENVRLFTELKESLEQQTATADILRVISQSPTDVQPVLDAVAKAAVRFCGATDAVVGLREESEFTLVAQDGPLSMELGRRERLDRQTSMGRSMLDARTCHLPNIAALDPAEWAAAQRLAIEFGQRAALDTPMIRDGVALGSIALRKPEPGPFTPRQIALLETFAAQAVIAIENVRLFTELKESLDQQTAMGEVLQAIPRSPTDVKPVLGAVARAAQRFCGAEDVTIVLRDGDGMTIAEQVGPLPSMLGSRLPLVPESNMGRCILDGRMHHLPDTEAEAGDEFPHSRERGRALGFRSTIAVPLLREGTAIGAIVLRRPQPGAYERRQIELLESFAAQAVIALENTRLFTELRESLDQQTATSDILRVISQSPTDVRPVLDAVVKAALRFCGAEDAVVLLREGEQWLIAGHEGPMVAEVGTRQPLSRQTAPGQAMLDGVTTHFPDIAALDPVEFAAAHDFGRRHGFQAALAAPMLRDGAPIGAIALRRSQPGAFSPRQIELLESFAAQAVIALENTRLFSELKESLDYQTATSELLEVISRSASDIQPVFDTILASAARLCGVAKGDIAIRQGDAYRYAASVNPTPEELAWLKGRVLMPGRGTTAGRALLERRVAQVVDQSQDSELVHPDSVKRARTVLAVPLLRDEEPVGVITLLREQVEAFSERQVTLIRTFADQAVIAMENARLLSELRESLDQQTATADILRAISQSPTDVQPVLDAVIGAAVRFCGAIDAVIMLRDGDFWESHAHVGPIATSIGQRHALIRQTAPGLAMLEARTVHFPDIALLDPLEYAAEQRNAERMGFKAVLTAPMLRDGVAIGVVTLRNTEPGPFTPRQIELLETFAAQAVIAIENVRLFTELSQRTDDLTQSLEYQTATSQVLEVISRSASDIQPVLDTMLAAAARLCEAGIGGVVVKQGNDFWYQALLGGTPELFQALRAQPIKPARGTVAGHTLLARDVVHVADIHTYPDYSIPKVLEAVRTALGVPLMREGELLGAIVLTRDRVEPFTERQIALVKTFADQAVIAMENARLLSELRESLDQQTATAEVLETINRSQGDLQPVFDAIVSKAMALCHAAFGMFNTFDGERYHTVATLGVPEAYARFRAENPPDYGPETAPGRLIAGGNIIQIADMADSDLYRNGDPNRRSIVDLGGARTILNLALRRDGKLLGMIAIYRQEVKPFTEQEIALVQGFAAQAVVAMENARLLGELRESLEYQTATSEVLEVISRSGAALQPVLDTMLSAALRLCRTESGGIAIQQGEGFHYVATLGWEPEADKIFRGLEITPGRGTVAARAIADGRIVQVTDVASDPEFAFPEMARIARWHTALGVPLMREGRPIGVIAITRDRVEPFTEREVALVRTFADQAVIAIENARLLGELTRREEELRITFDHMGDAVVMFDANLELASWNRNFQEMLDIPDSFLASRPGLDDYVRLLLDRGELGDQSEESQIARFRERIAHQWSSERTRPNGRILEVRNNPVPGGGSVLIYSDITERKKAESEIAAARDAAEAALERQTATADILKVIASSPTDVQPVLDVVAKAAVRFCGATDANIHLRDGDQALSAAHAGTLGASPGIRRPLDRQTGFGQAILDCRTIHVPDVEALNPVEFATTRRLAAEFGFRAVLVAPLLREGTAVGALSLRRVEPGAFTPQQIELLETFAAQAVIAIQNVRLFTELRDSLAQLKAAQANLVQSEKMASLGQLTAGIAHEIKNPLNFVNNFATLSVELLDELKEVAGPALATLGEDKRAELDETMELLVGNLGKIAEHGKRADGIVKSMLSHSRGGSGDWAPSDINALVEEALNLAYHGARAQDKEFNVTLERDFARESTPIEVVPQDVTRVFLNLFGNGFYAANKRRQGISKEGSKEAGFKPTIKVTTRDLGDTVEVRVRDNGIGIPADVRDKLFQPFFTTKPTGEGTGLGLSISYDIVTQQHGGTIEVESEPGVYTEFTVRLPRVRRMSEARGA